MMEALDDAGSYVYNDAQIRQPFDFANRTGQIDFEVDAKSAGSHTWWVELWITDQPTPAPHINSEAAVPQNGIAIGFNSSCNTPSPTGGSAVGSPISQPGEVDIVRNFLLTEQLAPWGAQPTATFANLACYQTMPDMRNHFQVKISQQRMEVWATDAMAAAGTAPKLISVMTNLNLPFSRGYVHLEHAQYNAEKADVSSSQTYHWDNIGFDGPVLPVAARFSVADALTPGDRPGSVNLGYATTTAGLVNGPLTIPGVDQTGATGATLGFNQWFVGGRSIKYRLNAGPWHAYTGPAPLLGAAWRTVLVPVALSELQSGNNTVDFASVDDAFNGVSNIDLTMAGATGSNPPPITSTPTNTPVTVTLTPTPTAVATSTCTPAVSALGVPPSALVGSASFQLMADCTMPGVAQAFRFSAGAGGSAAFLHAHLGAANTTSKVTLGLYSNSASNHPGNLLGQAAITNAVGGWNAGAIPATAITAGQVYWIAILQPAGAAGTIGFSDSIVGGSQSELSGVAGLATLPSVWSVGATTNFSPASVYAAAQ